MQRLERIITWRQRRVRLLWWSAGVVLTSTPALVAWNAMFAKDRELLMAGRGPLVTALVVGCLVLVVISLDHLIRADPTDSRVAHVVPERYKHNLAQLRHDLEARREELRRASVGAHPSLTVRRSLYREDAAEVVAQYGRESRHYRRVHNSLQSLIMVGSTAVTTIAALSQQEWTWQSVSVVVLGFSVTLASAFTGYYKYRERSYFLRQTADAIEEELNAVTLCIGDYSRFTVEQQDEALAQFTQRVEALRNEQRRREQQLDQPADQAAPATPTPTM
ncbi:DUF4231 domain-containing protein [Streptomyces spectabilis]|uniref:DUF4231 domain-containing protein n=1 Tax=Streptomyces spectabilis TaxID=68270 RepID=A0A7W8B2L5_STRST|nr:DUF4231 domain-containing protein [Streptomyces spectabilis]MBB5109209.1 hypothetical protein [Streptomyces spectabilis]MCI3907764.1 DUF4231 domain-containing protein [Streptomyces spectabilis]GGV51377.1 hypothetical protein GCM10010245_81000 [Streptomyces spectabilis]